MVKDLWVKNLEQEEEWADAEAEVQEEAEVLVKVEAEALGKVAGAVRDLD